jgi:hypothetical protein
MPVGFLTNDSTPCFAPKLTGELLRSLPRPRIFLPSRARYLNTVAVSVRRLVSRHRRGLRLGIAGTLVAALSRK